MNQYRYKAVTAEGLETSGFIDAKGVEEVAFLLRERRLVPIQIEEDKGEQADFVLWPYITTQDQINLLKQFAMMTRAGITVPSAISELSTSVEKHRMREILSQVKKKLQEGVPLSQAIIEHKALFPPMVSGVVESAEQTGELSDAFERLAEITEFRKKIKWKTLMSMAYPVTILVVASGVVYAMLFWYIPKLTKFLAKLGKPLPSFTQKVFGTAAKIQDNIGLIMLGVAMCIVLFTIFFKNPRGRVICETVALRTPVIGTLIKCSELSVFSSTLGAMLNSGASIISSLSLVKKSLATVTYKNWVDKAKGKLLQGLPLESSLEKRLVPATARSIIKIGEKSGSLIDSLKELQAYYSDQLTKKINLLISLINPVMLISVGILVGVIYFAILLAVISS